MLLNGILKSLLRYFLLNLSNHKIKPTELEEHVGDGPHSCSGGLNIIAIDVYGVSGSERPW